MSLALRAASFASLQAAGSVAEHSAEALAITCMLYVRTPKGYGDARHFLINHH